MFLELFLLQRLLKKGSAIVRTNKKTDRKLLKSRKDVGIKPKYFPRSNELLFKNAELNLPNNRSITIRLDRAGLEYFINQNKRYQRTNNICYVNSWEHNIQS